VVADGGGLADDDADAVVDEEVRADPGARVQIHAGALMAVFRQHARQQRHGERVEDMGDALERDGQHAGVGEDDLLDAARGRIAGVGGLDIGLHDAAYLGQLGKEGRGDPAGIRGGSGIPGEEQAFFQFRGEALVNLGQLLVEPSRHRVLGEAGAFEVAREKHMHEVARQFGHAVLGGEIDPVEVVDAAIADIGLEQRLLDGGGDHAVPKTPPKPPTGQMPWVETPVIEGGFIGHPIGENAFSGMFSQNRF
jgi:hypothetical protein